MNDTPARLLNYRLIFFDFFKNQMPAPIAARIAAKITHQQDHHVLQFAAIGVNTTVHPFESTTVACTPLLPNKFNTVPVAVPDDPFELVKVQFTVYGGVPPIINNLATQSFGLS